jgi:hypothetical protein
MEDAVLETTLSNSDIKYQKISMPNSHELPKLEHKLSRALFSPGVHYLQDPRSKVYNFDPYLSEILPIDQFDFDSITKFVSSSKDKTLAAVTTEHNAKYYCSTSSMTGVLSHMHYTLSNFRPQSLLEFTRHIRYGYGKPTRGAQLPASVIVRKNGSIYSIDSEKSTDREMILSLMGNSLERMLTQTAEEFEKYKIDESSGKSSIMTEKEANVYHYAKMNDFIMRSQLDCIDERLPGTGTFDLKTRAVSAVRFDIAKVERDSTGYQILKTHGTYESFEREQLELVKSTLLKYGLQARIGDMDGIFVAYHNTVRMFGFEYFPLEKIDEILHSFGLPDLQESRLLNNETESDEDLEIIDMKRELSSKLADDEFKLSIGLWDLILKQIINKEIPDSSFRFITKAVPVSKFETKLRVIATQINDEEIENLQSMGKDIRSKLIENADNRDKTKEILEKHAESIEEANKKLRKDPIGFDIFIKNFIDSKESLHKHPIYQSLDSTWKIGVKLDKLSTYTSIGSYDEFLGERIEMMKMNDGVKDDHEVDEFVRKLRRYSERGQKIQENESSTKVWNND